MKFSYQNEIQFIEMKFFKMKFNLSRQMNFIKMKKIENRYLLHKVDLWDFLEVAILRKVGKQKTWLLENDMKAFYGQNIEYAFIHVLLHRKFMYPT